MINESAYLGMLLREERLKRNLELSEVAEGLCATSYLCKIELGNVKASMPLMKDLLDRLNLTYLQDETVLANLRRLIDDVFEGIFYRNDLMQDLQALDQNADLLLQSPLSLTYQVLKTFMNQEPNSHLEALEPYMDDRERAIYLLSMFEEDDPSSLAKAQEVDKLLRNSFGKLVYMNVCLHTNRFEEVKRMGEECLTLALNEGNLYSLIKANLLLGTTCLSEGHLQVAILYYERASRLIRNSLWQNLGSSINYNLGASYLELGELDLAAEHLLKVPRSYGFYLFHKLAFLSLAKNDIKTAKIELQEMRKQQGQDEVKNIIYKVTKIQLQSGFESDSHTLSLIEELIAKLRVSKHIGFMRFHRNLIIKVFIAHRKYKQAYEFERMLNDALR